MNVHSPKFADTNKDPSQLAIELVGWVGIRGFDSGVNTGDGLEGVDCVDCLEIRETGFCVEVQEYVLPDANTSDAGKDIRSSTDERVINCLIALRILFPPTLQRSFDPDQIVDQALSSLRSVFENC